jgi:hypothetical protein
MSWLRYPVLFSGRGEKENMKYEHKSFGENAECQIFVYRKKVIACLLGNWYLVKAFTASVGKVKKIRKLINYLESI